MELISLIIVGVLFGFFKPSNTSNNSKKNSGLSNIEKYKTFENTRNKKGK